MATADRLRVVAIVQARMGSQRFPGKMLASLAGRPMLEWVLHRVRKCHRLDAIVLATSADPRNAPLIELAGQIGVQTFIGDEDDVLGRFCGAALAARAQVVVRICADNPFVAPEEITRIVEHYLAVKPDYAFNHVPRLGNGYADGFGAEVLSHELLRRLSDEATTARQREHVTALIWDEPGRFAIATMSAPPELAYPNLAFDVDVPEDLIALEPLAARIGIDGTAAEFVQSRLASVRK